MKPKRKLDLEVSELYTVAVAHGYKNPLEMIDDLLKQKKDWEDNINYILGDDPDVVRMREGGGPENLIQSLCVTVAKTRRSRDAKKL